MATVLTDSTNYENIADAIRNQNGTSETYYPSAMAAAISELSPPTAVLYTEQTLSDEQKAQARINIGALSTEAVKSADKPYLTFSSPNSFTLQQAVSKHWDGILEYSTDETTWSTWDGATKLSSINNDREYVIYLRGTGNTVITGGYGWILTGSNISCIGNIENLLDYATVASGGHPPMASNCYDSMFQGCPSLTQAPALPATTLASRCYYNMFRDCDRITQAPALPATTLADRCYMGMFQDCSSLTQVPTLPATTLANNCYQNMFNGCTALTQAPALPATTLADYCYRSMFQGCSSLTKAPSLPATTLKSNCYYQMFRRCSSITQAPALPATTLVDSCYYGMFQDCTNLTQAPVLPATTLATNCYKYMFYGCPSLTKVPALPATTLSNYCYQYMFYSCTSLKLSTTKTGEYTQEYRIPSSGTGTISTNALTDMFASTGGTFTGTPEINTIYYLSSDNMVVYDTEVATLREYVGSMIDASNGDVQFKPEGKSYLTFSSPNSFTLKVNDVTKHWDGTMEYFASDKTWTAWDGTTTLSSAENDGEYVLYLRGTGNTVITGNSQNYHWVLTGSDISCIGNIENLLDYATVESGAYPTMGAYCYNYMFYNCTSLTNVPDLPATTLSDYCYANMFYGCTILTHAPDLPATTLASYCYQNMFYGCTSLTNVPDLPATTLTTSCYSNMFNGCTSLTQAPSIPATTLATGCYIDMFRNCTSLTQAPALPATTLADRCYMGMFNGCTSLNQAPALPATTLSESCYAYMFSGCTSLTKFPDLLSTSLRANCYSYMFRGCTSLKLSTTKTREYTQEYRIPSSGTGTISTNALTDMFASTGGTFTGTPEINTIYYLSSDNMVVRETEIATLNGYVGSMINGTSHIIEQNKGLQQKFWRGTQDEYDAIETKSDDTMYIVTDDSGSGGGTVGDMTKAIYDPQGKAQDIFNYVDDAIQAAIGNAIGGSY